MITWNPNDMKGAQLTRNNLRFYNSSTDGWARATEGRASGKWYWEVKMENPSDYHAVGVVYRKIVGDLKTSDLNFYRYYRNGRVYKGNSNKLAEVDSFESGDIVGVLLDMNIGLLGFTKNGVTVIEGISIDSKLEMFPVIWGGYSGGTSVVNFGATEFDIVNSNPKEWTRLKSEGYLPYDIASAKTNWFYIPDIKYINISKTNIWHEDRGSINLNCSISHASNMNIKYEVLLDNIKILELDNFISTPTDINIDIPIDLFTKEENLLELVVFDEDGVETSFKYNVIKENRDTFTFKRIFDYKEDYITDENIEVIYGRGLTLKEIGRGEVNIEIPTEGKSKIKNIEVEEAGKLGSKVPIIPSLSSNNQNGYEISASSVYNSTYPAWKAFDGKNASATDAWLSSDKSPQWLQIKLPKPIIANKYSITSRVQYPHPPKSWVFQGSVDGAVWVDLDVQVDVPDWEVNETREYYIRQNIDSYQWYRIYITDSYGNDNYIAIGELQLYEILSEIQEELTINNPMTYIKDLGAGKVYESRLLTEYSDITNIVSDGDASLIESNNKYYTYQNNEFIEVEPTIENFENNSIDLSTIIMPNEDGVKPYRLLDKPSIVTYTEDEEVPMLFQTVLASTKVRFLVSKDKINYQVYRNSEWTTVNQDNILEQGMTKAELESIPQEAWAEWVENEAHKHSFDILMGMYSESPNPIIRSITVNYAENESPIIINAYIEPDTIHNEFATLKANVKDFEGDRISFKVLIKKAGTDEFVQVSPSEGWYNRNASETEITQAFNYPYFNPGENEVKLVVKDERGAEVEWTGKVILSNTDPIITITYDDFSMKATIGDDDGDDIAYRISVNGELIFDYTDFTPTKTFVNYVFAEHLKFGEENTIKLEVKDTHGGYASQEFTVIGTYRGLMFKNESGEYFVDNKGEVLMDLLFDKTLIGGQTSETKKVILENRHEFPITNVQITPENPNFVDGAVLELSETEMPFNPKNIIKILETMPVQGTKDFYVRIKTNRDAYQGGYFYIKSTASPVIK